MRIILIGLAALALVVGAAFYFVRDAAYDEGYAACQIEMERTLREASAEMRESRKKAHRKALDRDRDALIRDMRNAGWMRQGGGGV